MSTLIEKDTYNDWKVLSITKIKNKYGFRVALNYGDGKKVIQQKSGYQTRSEAEMARNNIIAQLTNHTYIVNEHIKVKTFFCYWLNEVMKDKIEYNTFMAYRNVINNYIIKELGDLNMDILNQYHVRNLYNYIVNKSTTVAKLTKTVMNTGLDYAKEKNLVSLNVAKDVSLPKQVKKTAYRTLNIDSTETYSIEQVKTLIEFSKNTPIHLEVMFAVLMGMRISEINALKYSDIDYVNRRLYASVQLGRDLHKDSSTLKKKTITKQEKQMKTRNSQRWIDIPDILFNAIIEQKQVYERNKSRRINDKHNPFIDDGYICCSTYGHSRSKGYHYDYYVKLIEDAKLPYIRFHDLRHTYTTILVKANFSIKAISKLLGHANEIITVDVYTDKSAIIEDCLEELTPYIDDVIPNEIPKIKNYDYSDIEINLDEYFCDLYSSNF